MTVLANEQVIDGKGWRSGAPVERRKLSQWFFKITAFSDELLAALDNARPLAGKSPRLMQKNWIGRSEGLRFAFALSNGGKARRLYDAPRHAVRRQLRRAFARSSVDGGIGGKRIPSSRPSSPNAGAPAPPKQRSRRPRSWATTPASPPPIRSIANWKLPVMVANFVLMGYGTGAIFGCPAHDQRDLDFARKYKLPVLPVVVPEGADPKTFAVGDEAYVGPGRLANSRFLDGMTVEAAKDEVATRLEKRGRRQAHGELPFARLAGVAPAALGLSHPDGALRQMRRRAGEGSPICRSSCPTI